MKKLAMLVAAGIPLLSILWALDVPLMLGLAVAKTQFLAVLFGLGVALVYLSNMSAAVTKKSYLDMAAAAASVLVFGWIGVEYQRFLEDFAYLTMEMTVLGAIAVVLTLEALRRATGWILLCLIATFVLYALFGGNIPAPLTGTSVTPQELAVYLAFDPNALLGTPLSVVATIVVVFIFFGKILVKTGCGEFFIDLAMAGMGKKRGGAAKISIVGSALFGSISGSAVSNVVTTGVMTIPLMRRSGYTGVQAGAIEAIASTGGQLMPPIMGAAAFLMAQSLEIPYAEVVMAALIPAILYYISVFIQVDLIAARDDISAVESEYRSVGRVMREGWHFIIPFAILLYAMFALNSSAAMAALYGTAAIIIAGFIRSYRGHKLDISGLFNALPDTGKSVVELIMIVGGAGLVIGLLNISSGGFALTLALVQLGSASIAILLLVSAGVCILLGMGMPTSGVYVLLAALVAPSLIETGIDPMAAHMFILYFGMMSMITPPIALAAFAAATISEEKPMKTGFEAMRLGWVAYVIPMLFIFTPALIMKGNTFEILLAFVLAVVGIYFISVAIVGFFQKKVGALIRWALLLAGVLAMLPEQVFELGYLPTVAGVIAGIGLLYVMKQQARTVVSI
ncbi:TRAP transporter permease [Leucothrix arctica]|uniref:C4-dicarboxylate ABC transporter permease n=1 Tax=Leucothrix arctica TaxID=1481894 RepID=A0A317C959_9GAMM|nr:TRAP transporter fused permease subunit [Leucothrix arctica]PWQ94711.1 C4-dicarboxylate ABC transporter permease [Leucothrix arctica]